MAETKTSISELTAATSVGQNDLLFISQQNGSAWNSKKATVSQLPFGQGTITGITMNGASKGTSGNVDLGTVLTAHQSLASYYTKSDLTGTNGVLKGYSLTSHVHDGYVPTSRTVAGKALTANITAAELSSAIGLDNYSLTSHTHTGYASSTHVHGSITNAGAITAAGVALASGDSLAFVDSSDSSKVKKTSITFDGSTTTQFLSKKGTFETALTAHQSLTAYYTKAELTGTTGVLTGYSLTSHTHSQYLTAVPSTYKTYTDTKTQLGTDGFKTYAATLSSLSSTYSLTSHTHSQYSLTSHNHTGVYAPATHAHGNMQNSGTLQTTDITIANGDKLVVTDASDSNKIARTSLAFDGSTTTQFLSKKGTWETPTITGYVSKAELKTALASVGQIPSGDGANLENTIAKFNALFAALSALTD